MPLFKLIAVTADLPAIGTRTEGFDFDMKGEIGSIQYELAKDIAAFANAVGGTILVGAQEDRATNTCGGYNPNVTEERAKQICDAYSKAAVERCSPAPFVPPHQILNPTDTGWVAAINVVAYPAQAIGVRAEGASVDGPWMFPIRLGRDTKSVRPERLAMLMDARSRRSAVLLESIPADFRRDVLVRAKNRDLRLILKDVHILENTVQFIGTGSSASPAYKLHLPIDVIQLVWRAALGDWIIAIQGTVDRDDDAKEYKFSP